MGDVLYEVEESLFRISQLRRVESLCGSLCTQNNVTPGTPFR